MRKPRERKPTEPKQLLIELLLAYSEGQCIDDNSLLILYNGLLYPKVKILNKNKVKMIEKAYLTVTIVE